MAENCRMQLTKFYRRGLNKQVQVKPSQSLSGHKRRYLKRPKKKGLNLIRRKQSCMLYSLCVFQVYPQFLVPFFSGMLRLRLEISG